MDVFMGYIVLFVTFLDIIYVNGVYFTMTDVKMTIPAGAMKQSTGERILAGMKAFSSRKSRRPPNLKYSLKQPKDGHFRISHATGDLTFSKSFLKSGHLEGLSSLSASILAVDSSGDQNDTLFTLTLSTLEKAEAVDCYLFVDDLCFWQTVTYRILENRDAAVMGTLSSPFLLELCPGFRLNYTIINKESRVELIPPAPSTTTIINKPWSIKSKSHLERDVNKKYAKTFRQEFGQTGEFIRLLTRCSLVDPQGTTREIEKNITVKVLDEDDNLPKPQHDGDVYIELDGNIVEKDQVAKLKHKGRTEATFMFIDKDSPSVNKYVIDIANDTLGLFKPNCRIFEDDSLGEPHTAIYCEIMFTKRMEVPSSQYTVFLQINDTSYIFKNRSVVRIPIHLHPPNSTGPHSMGMTEPPANFEKPLIIYPQRTVAIFRSAGPLARITQPKETIKDNRTFVILESRTHNGAFDVTQTEGIVYVHDVGLLRASTSYVSITVQWNNTGKFESDDLILHIIEEPGNSCSDVGSSLKEWSHCAEEESPKNCENACAIATAGIAGVTNHNMGGTRRCIWRGAHFPDNTPTRLYATCTPDNITCPDGICDALERLHIKICPQDCADQIIFPAKSNPATSRGIYTAAGVCTCTSAGRCSCGPREKKIRKQSIKPNVQQQNNSTIRENPSGNSTTPEFLITSPAPSLSRHTVYTDVETARCGKGCLFGILAGGVFLVLAVAAAVACWRFERVHKVRGKYAPENNDLSSAPLSDYVDRGGIIAPENTITLNFDMTTSLSQQHGHKIAPDPKWEFPRSQLVIEQTLGEGEFGRVLRARAKDISGQDGYTIVAVKTLKEDAREAELADLLSEYELLKGCSHPNVIRLLGASTLPGGPVYLIIEFAHYGSLRSYLRRSRHLKSESRMPFSLSLDENTAQRNDNYDEPKHCKVTATDILSFAWQISNGMSYLSDVKLVHRDLAARNVLLTEEKVCKISDFGLTRDIYEDDAYFKRSKGRVPVKWMAPESLSDHVYTSKSDVWSFGILVWELVTLGATPYPGIQVQNLFHLLKTGYRMERPDNCSPALYKIMRSCWHIDPEQRPSFRILATKWEQMLGDQVEYLDLTPNAIHNRSYFCSLDDSEDDEDNTTAASEDDEDNLAGSKDVTKCADGDKLLEDGAKIDNLQPETAELERLQLSPLAQGYVTPVKTKQTRTTTPTNENPQYYTNMDPTKK